MNEESTWDGGFIELSVDGNDYFIVTPEGGYPCEIYDFIGVPFPAGTPVFGGEIDWERVNLDLSAYSGVGRLRFVFGSSESMNTGEGWYLDDIEFNYNVESEESEVPGVAKASLNNYPNPFNPTTTISFSLNTEITENTEIKIYNVKGQLVKSFSVISTEAINGGVERSYAARQSVIWNGTDKHNNPVSSGVYFATLKSGDNRVLASRKMLLLK